MRVALVHLRHRPTGGTERYLNQMASYLAQEGHSVSIVCRSHEEAPHPAVRFVRLHSPAIGAAWRFAAFARAVQRHVGQATYDVVFALGRTWSHDVIRLGGGCHQSHLDAAGSSRRSLQDRVILAIERRALAPAAYRRVVTNSEMVRRDVIERYAAPSEKVTVIRNGVDLAHFHAERHQAPAAALRRSCGFEDDAFVVLFLGNGYQRKGLDLLLDAFPDVLSHCPAARLLVVGDDSRRARFEQHAERLGIAGRTRFLGGRRDAQVCFAAANLYVLPTRYDPFANSTLEALASGLPVVTTTTNGASEILTHRVHGSILSAGRERQQLGGEILFWSKAAKGIDSSGATRRLAEHFSRDSTVRASTELLQLVLADKERGARPR